MAKIKRTCQDSECNNSFYTYKSLDKKFCSKSCGARNKKDSRPSQKVKCDYCGNNFKKSASALDKTESNYCSRKCCTYGTYEKRKVVSCDFCNKELKRIPSRINTTNFCNKRCKGLYERSGSIALSKRENNKIRAGRSRLKISDGYAKDLLRQNTGIEKVPAPLVELKKVHLKTKRLIKSKKS